MPRTRPCRVFEVAWRRRLSVHFSDDGDVLPSLLATANLLLKRHRTTDAQRALLQHRLGLPDHVPDPSVDVVDNLAKNSEVHCALVALQRLRQSDRELIEMCVLEGLSAEQAAAVLDARPGTVRTRLSRALNRPA